MVGVPPEEVIMLPHPSPYLIPEQTAAVAPGQLGKSVGYLCSEEMRRVEAALRIVLNL